MATGGSTNAVLHFLAIARAAGVDLTMDDFQRISDRVPFIADLKPSGRYVMEDVHKVGGTPAVLKYLHAKGLIDGSPMTCTGARAFWGAPPLLLVLPLPPSPSSPVSPPSPRSPSRTQPQKALDRSSSCVLEPLSMPPLSPLFPQTNKHNNTTTQQTGKTMAENLAAVPELKAGQDVILPLEAPIKPEGHIQILYGNLSPEGSVAKITGKEGLRFEGTALCFDAEEDMLEALAADPSKFKGTVVVIRYEGPKGGPGMPEMLTPTSAIMGAGLGKECALITGARLDGGAGFCVVVPAAVAVVVVGRGGCLSPSGQCACAQTCKPLNT